MKRVISVLLSALTLVIFLTGCDLFQKGGTITIKNDTREYVGGSYYIEVSSRDSSSGGNWDVRAGKSWSYSADEDAKYSISFPFYRVNDEYHDGKTKSGSLTGGEDVTLYVSSYVPGLEPFSDYVQFKNENPVSVTVYRDSAHQNKIADITKESTSSYLTNLSYYNRNRETHLYLVYHLFGAAEFPYSYDFINTVNIASKTPLPTLSQLAEDEKNKVLTNDVYIVVENVSTFSLVLVSGSNEIRPLGSSSSILASGKTGVYRVNAASSYHFRQNTTNVIAFPSGLSAFSNGKLYVLRYSGGSSLSWALNNYASSSTFTISVAGALSYTR